MLHNVYFHNLSEALQVFTQTYGREYRPMVRFSLWVNSLMGSTALPFKLTNLALHLGCCLMIFYLLKRLGSKYLPALLATALFALHPIHITSIHFVLGRTDLMAAFFYLTTLVLVVNWPERPRLHHHLITLFAFSLALLSKELAVTLPAAMGLILLAHGGKLSKALVRQLAQKLWVYAAFVLVFVGVRIYLWEKNPDAIAVYTQFSLSHILSNYGQWLFALVYPGDLYQAQDLLAKHPLVFVFIATLAIMAIGTGLFYLLWPYRHRLIKAPLIWLALLWFPLTLLPMAGGNPHRWYLYLPSMALSFALAGIWPLVRENGRRLFAVGVGLFLILCTWETLRESHDWKRQDEINRQILSQLHALHLAPNSKVYFINIPFGYKGTFLFSFSSLAEAMAVTYGETLQLIPLSYINLDQENRINIRREPEMLEFDMIPTAYRYFMLSASERRFNQPAIIERDGFTLQIVQLAGSGKIQRYRIIRKTEIQAPVYYFDGSEIKVWN
ncbi:MAG: phospholipid carrier-dependent glycosyltransferase [Gammaproteobacteria bacterium]|nr:MAG: phospholipid carrier-dependent glycosyltransferase [Gammaproteobacteria bacterium]